MLGNVFIVFKQLRWFKISQCTSMNIIKWKKDVYPRNWHKVRRTVRKAKKASDISFRISSLFDYWGCQISKMYYYTRLRRNKTLFGKVARKKLFLKATSPSAFKSTAGSLCLSPITPNSSFLSLHAKYVCFCFFKGQGFFFYKQKKSTWYTL